MKMRADRQPEFTQIDIEVAFMTAEDIYKLVEGLLEAVFKSALDTESTPFDRRIIEEAINRFGIDKPDSRFGMELVESARISGRQFSRCSAARSIPAASSKRSMRRFADITTGQIDEMTEIAKSYGAKGLPSLRSKVANGRPIVKFFSEAEKTALQ